MAARSSPDFSSFGSEQVRYRPEADARGFGMRTVGCSRTDTHVVLAADVALGGGGVSVIAELKRRNVGARSASQRCGRVRGLPLSHSTRALSHSPSTLNGISYTCIGPERRCGNSHGSPSTSRSGLARRCVKHWKPRRSAPLETPVGVRFPSRQTTLATTNATRSSLSAQVIPRPASLKASRSSVFVYFGGA